MTIWSFVDYILDLRMGAHQQNIGCGRQGYTHRRHNGAIPTP